MRVEVVEMVFCFLEDLIPGALKQRLVEIAIPHFAGEIADRRISFMGHGDDAIEKGTKGIAGRRSGSLGTAQTTLENIENRGDLPGHPMVRFANPQQRFFQSGRSSEFVDTVVRQRAAEGRDKGRRKLLGIGFDHTQIREQV